LQLERSVKGQEGFLLKRRLSGLQPERGKGIIDYQTDEIVDPGAAATVGTEYIDGYYAAIPCVFADPENVTRNERLDGGRSRGTINDDLKVKATMLAVPQVDSGDVWVDKNNDFRWLISRITHAEEINGVPIVLSVDFSLLPSSHPVYLVQIPGQSLLSP
jgi:hypothetical protein